MPNIQKEKKKSNMEPWLLNWTSFILSNTQAEIDGLKYADGPEWTQRMFESWKKNSHWGQWVYATTYGLSVSQAKKLEEWKTHIKAIYGEYGEYEYTFSPNGVGVVVTVYSSLANTMLDLTESDTW
jgi:hypothetical protein